MMKRIIKATEKKVENEPVKMDATSAIFLLAMLPIKLEAADTNADLPVKHLPTLKEGTYVSGVNSIIGVITGAPHANAAKLVFNWLLSREGQELHGRTAQQPTRRLDIDTKGLDGQVAKDVLTLEEFRRFQNFTKDKCNNSWFPGAKLAEAVLK
jgi:ABC-type Fe3+ transport system substrate-binding protein